MSHSHCSSSTSSQSSKPWVSISAQDLESYLNAPQVSAIREAAIGDEQEDAFDDVAPRIVDQVRNDIQGTRAYLVSVTPGLIPPELHMAVCWLIIEALNSRIPGLALTEDQKTILSDQKERLRRMSEGTLPISMPPDPLRPVDVQGAVGPSVGCRPRHFDQCDQNGI